MSEPSQSKRKPNVCFVALNAYNLLSGRKDINHTGGAEVQQVRIASWLVREGYSVRFVTLDHGQPDGIVIRGIRVQKAYAKEDGIRGLRFVHPRWSGLWAAMARANADVYYHRCAEAETGQVALWCCLHRRKFIFALANDSNCDPKLLASSLPWRERILYWLGLRLAHAVTAQTQTQQDLLLRNMRLSSVLVRNCGWNLGECTSRELPLTVDSGSPIHVLWVGRISKSKRLERLLNVAKRCPEMMFDVIGAPSGDYEYASSLIKRAVEISNVKMHGYVPYNQMIEYYQRCHVLCCTSAYEGFPNTFLEAWSLGIPIVSTFDPDGVIISNGLGLVAQGVERIVACLREITQSSEIWLKASRAARQYYLANHAPEVCLPIFERLFLEVAGN